LAALANGVRALDKGGSDSGEAMEEKEQESKGDTGKRPAGQAGNQDQKPVRSLEAQGGCCQEKMEECKEDHHMKGDTREECKLEEKRGSCLHQVAGQCLEVENNFTPCFPTKGKQAAQKCLGCARERHGQSF
jgi:hypothetical protein